MLRESLGSATQLIGEGCASVELEKKGAERARPLGDARLLGDVETDLAEEGVVQRHELRRAAERGGDRREALDVVGVGEESRRGAQGSHAGTMPARDVCTVIVSLRAAPELCVSRPGENSIASARTHAGTGGHSADLRVEASVLGGLSMTGEFHYRSASVAGSRSRRFT